MFYIYHANQGGFFDIEIAKKYTACRAKAGANESLAPY